MQVVLSDVAEAAVRRMLSTGEIQNAEDAVEAALLAFEDGTRDPEWVTYAREKIQSGIDQLDRGERIRVDETFWVRAQADLARRTTARGPHSLT